MGGINPNILPSSSFWYDLRTMTSEAPASARAGLWTRWKGVAERAAEVQSNVLLFLLYFLVFLPIALVRRLGAERFGSRTGWQPHADRPPSLAAARRQF